MVHVLAYMCSILAIFGLIAPACAHDANTAGNGWIGRAKDGNDGFAWARRAMARRTFAPPLQQDQDAGELRDVVGSIPPGKDSLPQRQFEAGIGTATLMGNPVTNAPLGPGIAYGNEAELVAARTLQLNRFHYDIALPDGARAPVSVAQDLLSQAIPGNINPLLMTLRPDS